jgi:hypothetical protein
VADLGVNAVELSDSATIVTKFYLNVIQKQYLL